MSNETIEAKIDIEKDIINTVTNFVREVLGKGAGFIPEKVVYKNYLWIIRGEITYMGDYTYVLSYFSDIIGKPSEEIIDILITLRLTEKTLKNFVESFKDLKFCFYVSTERKRLCAFNLCFGETNFFDKINYTIKEKDPDAKDICKKAKEFLSVGTTFKYFDFLPIIAIYDVDRWKVVVIVSYYKISDVIPRIYYFEYSTDGTFKSFKGF